MTDLIVIVPEKPSPMLEEMIFHTTNAMPSFIRYNGIGNIPNLKNKRLLLAIELDDFGLAINTYKLLKVLQNRGHRALENSSAALLVHSNNELFTKSVASHIILYLNSMGCTFMGHPLVEAIGSLRNFLTLQKVIKKSLREVCFYSCSDLGKRLALTSFEPIKNPKITVLHSSNYKYSNTLTYWHMVKQYLKTPDITEIHIENGSVQDCHGCLFNTCKYFGQQKSCFYGGIMVNEIYPAILDSDIILWICPNYNDSISANLMATINRLTAIYRTQKFYEKSIFAIVVSGNSGSDLLARQLINALNINKSFKLPPYFYTSAIANDRNSILLVPSIQSKAEEFAKRINQMT